MDERSKRSLFSFANTTTYPNSSFTGAKVFEYETSEQGMWWCIDKCYKPETLIDIKTKFRDAQGMFENLLETYPDDKDINLFSRKLNELFKLMGENNETLAD